MLEIKSNVEMYILFWCNNSSIQLSLFTSFNIFLSSQESLCTAFATADEYSSKFEPYRDYFEENEKLEIEIFKDAGYG